MIVDRMVRVTRYNKADKCREWADVKVGIVIDEKEIARLLGPKAAQNKTRRSRALSGAIIVEAPQLIAWKV